MVKTIFLANLAEVALPLASLMKKARAEEEIFEDHALCDRFIFSATAGQVLITPFPIDKRFFSDSCRLLNLKRVVNLSPKKLKKSLCLSVFGEVAKIVKENPGVRVISYAATPEFYELVDYLKDKGLKFVTPEAPKKENFWAADFFDSKAGFRQAVSTLPSFPKMPEGATCFGKREITGWAKKLLEKYGGCVVKTNHGLAGAGLKIVKNLNDLSLDERFWLEEEAVVERFIPPDLAVGGGAPNIELCIRDSKVEPLYVCGMRVSKEGVFQGVEMGRAAIPRKISQVLIAAGKNFGDLLVRHGYRGYFETDWVFGADQKLYPLEANLRRTGGTHVYDLGRQLLGRGFFNNYFVVANNNHHVERASDYAGVKDRTSDLFYPLNGKKEGVIVTVTNCLKQGKIGYVVVAGNRERAREIEESFQKRLG